MTTRASQHTRDMTYCALSAVVIAACAWLTIPAAVPFTLQTFGVFMALGLLGGRKGTRAILVYILLGAVGIPVFSGFQGGLGTLLGTTGGYILGFLLTGLIYWAVTARFGSGLPVMAVAMVLGHLACYAFGTAWFIAVYARTSGTIGLGTALAWCVFPFILPDLAKLALALTLSRRLRKVLN